MMEIIPTYLVTVLEPATSWRVPETSLETFLHVLIFNGTRDFRVTLETDDRTLLIKDAAYCTTCSGPCRDES